MAIDSQLLAKDIGDEEIIEVTNGRICCHIHGDLVQALNNLHAKVLGLADPALIIQTFFQDQ